MTREIKLLSWNVNGVRAAYKKGFLERLSGESPDILCVQETKASPDQLPAALLDPPGYRTYWSAAEKKGYSGVGVFSRYESLRTDTTFADGKFDTEGRFLQLEFSDFVLLNVYFPNGKKNRERLDYKMDFYEAFLETVNELRTRFGKVVFCGDVNTAHREIDLARPKENENVSGFLPIERAWIDRVVSAGWVDTFRSLHPDEVRYSWWDLKSKARERNVGWRIDYVFVNAEMLDSVTSAFILTDVTGSDHCPVGVKIICDQGDPID